jgi:hypothetical protein
MSVLRPILFCVALLGFAALVVACAGDGLALSHAPRECTASSEAVDAYVARINGLVSNRARSDILEPRESAWVSFALGRDGSASEFRVERTKRSAAGQEVLRAAAAAAPYPRPPFDPLACLVGGRATIGLIGLKRCDDTRVDEYTEMVSTRIQRAVAEAGIAAPEGDKIALRVKIDREGAPVISVLDAQSGEVGERVAVVARELAPFEAPDDSVAQCVADSPIFVWIELPGLTRAPIRVH